MIFTIIGYLVCWPSFLLLGLIPACPALMSMQNVDQAVNLAMQFDEYLPIHESIQMFNMVVFVNIFATGVHIYKAIMRFFREAVQLALPL